MSLGVRMCFPACPGLSFSMVRTLSDEYGAVGINPLKVDCNCFSAPYYATLAIKEAQMYIMKKLSMR